MAKTKNDKLVNVRAPAPLIKDAATAAERDGETLSAVIRRLLREWLKRQKG